MVEKICCVGAGYVGGPTSVVIANRCPNIQVTVVDMSEARISAWRSNTLPFYEPGLDDMVFLSRDGVPGRRSPNLFFTTDLDPAISEADLIFLCVDTPTQTSGPGAGCALDLGRVEAAVAQIARARKQKGRVIVVEKSTVPCGTGDRVREILAMQAAPGVQFEVLSNPEFLSQGSAIVNLLQPDRVVIGSYPSQGGSEAAACLEEIYARWVPRSRIVQVILRSSELAKVVANGFLAQRLSSINTISAICERTGADITEVSRCVGLDSRIGSQMLRASAGFGGSCFRKDIMGLVHLAESLQLPEVATYWKHVVEINEWQERRLVRRMLAALPRRDKQEWQLRIAVFGFTFKRHTNDTRESPAISAVAALIEEGAHIAVYDPIVAPQQVYHDLYRATRDRAHTARSLTVTRDPYRACTHAQAILILTDWEEFRVDPAYTPDAQAPMDIPPATPAGLNWARISHLMTEPRLVCDACSVTNSRLQELGFRPLRVGHQDPPASRPSKL